MEIKKQHFFELKQKEEYARERINHHRNAIKSNISQNKESVFFQNKVQRSQVKEQQDKIKESIQFQRLKHAEDKQKNAQDLYQMKKRAKYTRAVAE